MYNGLGGGHKMIGRRRTDETNLMRANAGSHIQSPLRHPHTNSWIFCTTTQHEHEVIWMNSASCLQGWRGCYFTSLSSWISVPVLPLLFYMTTYFRWLLAAQLSPARQLWGHVTVTFPSAYVRVHTDQLASLRDWFLGCAHPHCESRRSTEVAVHCSIMGHILSCYSPSTVAWCSVSPWAGR